MKSPNKFQIVFVCTGNICRSPMAEGILKTALPSQALALAEVLSAGVGAVGGLPPSEHSVTACAEQGIDISSHRSRAVTRHLLEQSDLFLTMEQHHADTLGHFAPDLAGRFQLLARYALGDKEGEAVGIPDPIGGDLAEYRAARDQIHQQIMTAVARIEREILAGVNS